MPNPIDSNADIVFSGVYIPDEIIDAEFGKHMDAKQMCVFNHASKLIHSRGFFANRLAKEKADALELKTLVLQGEEQRVLQIIAQAPHLLFTKATEANDFARDHNGTYRTIGFGSPLQAMLGAGDIQMLRSDVVQKAVMENRLVALRQFNEQFPLGIYDPAPNYDYENLFWILVHCGTNSKEASVCLSALKKRFEFTRVDSGWHFNLDIIYHAHLALKAAYSRYSVADLMHKGVDDYFAEKVIGYLDSLVTTYDAQLALSNLLKNVTENEIKPIERGKLEFFDGTPFFAPGADNGLGVDMYIADLDSIQHSKDLVDCAWYNLKRAKILWLHNFSLRLCEAANDAQPIARCIRP